MSDDLSHKLIRASAGSGKTYRLTQRYLGLLRAGAAPDAILATTFTRKAAGEIMGRVVAALAENAEKDPADRALLTDLCRRLHRMTVSTIDSFFFGLASRFALELDLPADPVVVAEGHPAAVALRHRAIQEVLDEGGASDEAFDALAGLLRRLYHDEARRGVNQALLDVIDQHLEVFRQAPAAAVWTTGRVVGFLDGVELRAAIDALLSAEALLPAHKNWAKAWRSNCAAAAAGDWDAFLGTGIAAKVLEGQTEYYKHPLGAEWQAIYDPLNGHAQATYLDRILRQTAATHELLGRFVGVYDRLRRQHHVLLYSDVGRRLSDLGLGDDPALLSELYFRLDGQVDHLLLDEFQDTSLDQWRVLFPMADELTADEANGRSLFIVGDPKQAIYGWRGGCVELFDAAQTLRGVETEPMAQSYRSSQVVLDAVNRVFGDLGACASLAEDRTAADGWSTRFDEHTATLHKRGEVRFEVTAPPEDDHDATQAHLRQAAQLIKTLHEQAAGATIGVLLRTNKSIRGLLDQLRQAGLPASGEGGNPIADHPAVAAALSALVLADHPGDGPSAFHVANSPLGAVLEMSDMAAARRVSGQIRAALIERGFAAVLADWTRGLAASCDPLGLRRLSQLVELAEGFESGGRMVDQAPLRPSRFVDLVEAARVEEPGGSPIRVMTIHKSKGLQFLSLIHI